jgi:hypothetical protein
MEYSKVFGWQLNELGVAIRGEEAGMTLFRKTE